MKKYPLIPILLILALFSGLFSCTETNSHKGSLAGSWVSTKVDTLTQYIKPVKPEKFVSHKLKNCTLIINADGSIKMIESGDTISGSWNPQKPDSIKVAASKGYPPLYLVNLKGNKLTISSSIGCVSTTVSVGGGSNEKDWKCTISKHFTRK